MQTKPATLKNKGLLLVSSGSSNVMELAFEDAAAQPLVEEEEAEGEARAELQDDEGNKAHHGW